MEEILKILYKETQELKSSIELIELISENGKKEKGLLLEHLIKKFVNVKVKMYREHHNQPHIHLDIGNENHKTSISIETQEILAGTLEKKYEKIVNPWIKKNKKNLLIIWENMQNGQVFNLSVLN